MKSINVFEVFKNVIGSNLNIIEYTTVSIDSRKVTDNGIFLALKGEHTDGNLYIEDAFKNGFKYCVTTSKEQYEKFDGKNIILVEDGLIALKNLARWNIENYKGEKIVITGSVGKTSTKALATNILKQKYKVYEAFKNFNNELGISIVASNIDLTSEIAIFEIGTNNPGEIEYLGNMLKPDIGIITNIGHAHIGRFGSYENLKKEKLSLANAIINGGTLWLNDEISIDNDLQANIKLKRFGVKNSSDVVLKELNRSKDSLDFVVEIKNSNFARYSFMLKHPYDHFVYNLLPLIGIAFEHDLNYEEIFRGILEFSPVDGRGNILYINGITVIDDTYNAGYEAVISSIKNLKNIESDEKIAIMGEMAEIEGYEKILYNNLKNIVSQETEIRFILCGKNYKQFDGLNNCIVFEDKETLMKNIKIKKGAIYLVKASRGKKFEDIVNKIQEEAKLVI
ncbi:MAG: UDP-N-acetylmuramoyl-tripeptide--D-alanyl-D-alanine ligase [Deferribacterales bacterium]